MSENERKRGLGVSRDDRAQLFEQLQIAKQALDVAVTILKGKDDQYPDTDFRSVYWTRVEVKKARRRVRMAIWSLLTASVTP